MCTRVGFGVTERLRRGDLECERLRDLVLETDFLFSLLAGASFSELRFFLARESFLPFGDVILLAELRLFERDLRLFLAFLLLDDDDELLEVLLEDELELTELEELLSLELKDKKSLNE
jgi:hypothetical protein